MVSLQIADRCVSFCSAVCLCACFTCNRAHIDLCQCRYELHHGVRINDTALVEAAIMSDRYIADRFLPDKAIDLIDEAAAKLKMEITSKPLHLDEIDRKVSTSSSCMSACLHVFQAISAAFVF